MLLPFGMPPLAEAWRAGHGWEIAAQTVIQGVFSGILGLVAYGIAVARLGASKAAAFAALAPGMAAVIAIPVLGEAPDMAAVVGIVATSIGVALASGAVTAQVRGRLTPGAFRANLSGHGAPDSHSRSRPRPSAHRLGRD
jgi:drug/metabolite transporter (DMT)-like permease